MVFYVPVSLKFQRLLCLGGGGIMLVNNVPPTRQLVRINLDEIFITLDLGPREGVLRYTKASAAPGKLTEEMRLHPGGGDF